MVDGMIKYHVMSPSMFGRLFEKVVRHVPDELRTPEVFFSMCSLKSTVVFEVGTFQGAFWLSDIRIGWRANVHIVLWDKDVLKQYPRARRILQEVLDLFRLLRLQAFVPVDNKLANTFAEHMGFVLEGIARKAGLYNGEFVDLACLALLKEDLDG